MTQKTRHAPKFYIEQGEEIVKARDRVKKYLRLASVIPNRGTYMKICGVEYNGERNAKLNDKDLEVLNHGIDTVIEGLKEFKQALKDAQPPTQ